MPLANKGQSSSLSTGVSASLLPLKSWKEKIMTKMMKMIMIRDDDEKG